jgi:hypothetical protein
MTLQAITEVLNHISIWQTVFTFGFLALLTLLFLIYTRLHWAVKAGMIIATLFVFFLTYNTLVDSFGWPWKHGLPQEWKFSWVEITEPRGKDPGNIRLWIHEYDPKTHALDPRPRSYEIPYSVANHKTSLEVQRELKDGKDVYGKRKGQPGQGQDGQFDQNASGGGSGNTHGPHNNNSNDNRRGLWGRIGGWFFGDSGGDSYGGEYDMIKPPTDTLPPKDANAPNAPENQAPGGSDEPAMPALPNLPPPTMQGPHA